MPLQKAVSDDSLHQVHVKPRAADGHCWELDLVNRLGCVLESDDHLVVLPVVVRLVCQEDCQGGKAKADDDPEYTVCSTKVFVQDVA